MDKRKSYYLIADTEATNGLDDPIVYDLGVAIIDNKGKVYKNRSFVIDEVFNGMPELMKSAYYANKLPQYHEQIASGERQVVSYATARKEIHALCKEFNVKAIIAHNMNFDYRATTKTQRYITKSKFRYFFPYGIELWDTLKMSRDTICKQKTYIKWCEENNYLTKNGKPKATAEILYRYISGDNDFVESHTGLEDVMIEKEIFAHCKKQHKKMRKLAFGS
jgi:hypothetical protein